MIMRMNKKIKLVFMHTHTHVCYFNRIKQFIKGERTTNVATNIGQERSS